MTELHVSQLVLAKDIRISADAVSDEELLMSIQHHGISVPLLVRQGEEGMYEIWDGRRRFRLGQIAGLTRFPCEIRKMNDLEARLIAFVLNDQRQAMSVVEAGLWIMDELLSKFPELTQKTLAPMMGHSESWLSRRISAAEQYQSTPKEERRYLPTTERGLRELRSYTPEKQQQILAGAKAAGIAPTSAELIRRAKATMTPREVLEKWKYQESEFLIYMLQEEAGLTAKQAGDTLQKFKAKLLPWQQTQRKFQMPTRSDATVKLYAKLAEWYPPEVIDFIEKNIGAASSLETWKSRIQRFVRMLLQKAGVELRQSVLEEFRL